MCPRRSRVEVCGVDVEERLVARKATSWSKLYWKRRLRTPGHIAGSNQSAEVVCQGSLVHLKRRVEGAVMLL